MKTPWDGARINNIISYTDQVIANFVQNTQIFVFTVSSKVGREQVPEIASPPK